MRVYAAPSASALILALVSGCGSGREVEVTGSIRANASLSNGGARTVYIAEPLGEAPDALRATLKLVQDSFATTVKLEGDVVRFAVYADRDGDGVCDSMDATGETSAVVGEGESSVHVEIELDGRDCPVFAAE